MQLLIPLGIVGYFVVAYIKVRAGKHWFIALTWPCQGLWELGDDLAAMLKTVNPGLAAEITAFDEKMKAWQSGLDAKYGAKVDAMALVVQQLAQKNGIPVPPGLLTPPTPPTN